MAGIKEIRTRIDSVQQTLKITNAMYLISSSKLRKARQQLNNVQPYFLKISSTIADILHHSPEIEHIYFDKRPEVKRRKSGYIVITGDKGLAGAYNHNVLRLAEKHLAQEDDAHDKAVELQEETGMTFIHPYDDEQVIAGQGTIGLEILDQLPDVDAVIVPVGGGGLISGVAFAIKSLKPEVKVYGVQAEGAPSMYRSLHEHKYQTLSAVSTFADGIQVKTPGELTYKLCEEYVDDIVTVTEDETAAAILSLMENQKLVAEGAGAVPVAAALFHKLPIEGKKVVCLISGGNIDVNILSRVITRGLVMSGRKANLTIALEDKPGQLQRVAEIVSRCGSNVVSVQHDGSDPNMPISSCFLKLTLETRDAAQIEQIRAELTKEGFQLVSERV